MRIARPSVLRLRPGEACTLTSCIAIVSPWTAAKITRSQSGAGLPRAAPALRPDLRARDMMPPAP
jgi:hypothetical protein